MLPRRLRDPNRSNLAGWWVQSFGRACTASSSLADHPPELAADENVRTWWSAETGDAGEWFQMDLGPGHWVHAVQVNHAEQDSVAKGAIVEDGRPRFRLLGSVDGDQWLTLADHSQKTAAGPHTYLAFDAPRPLRFLKVVNISVPAGGKFALRDLRVFGRGDGTPPAAVVGFYVRRHQDDDRNATLTWTPATAADGYLLRFGIGPDQLFQTIQLQGRERSRLTTHALNRGVRYAWRIDAFNASGLTPGVVVWPPPTSSKR